MNVGQPARYSRCARQRGFTLLEILAAFLIFSLSFAAVLQILSSSLRNTVRSAEFTQAALWAQTKMDAVGVDPVLEEGSSRGDFDDKYSWELDITPYEVVREDSVISDENSVVLYEVDLAISWGDDLRTRVSHFKTLRAAPLER